MHFYITTLTHLYSLRFQGGGYAAPNRGGSGSPAGTVWAEPLFEFLTLLLAINHYKTTN